MANLVDHLRVSARFATWEALEGGKYKIGGVLEVKHGLRAVEIFSRFVGERAIFHLNAPLTAPFAINFDAKDNIDAFDQIPGLSLTSSG